VPYDEEPPSSRHDVGVCVGRSCLGGARNLWSTSREGGDPQRSSSCAYPGEPLTEWENQMLEQVLTDLSGFGSPELTAATVLMHA